MLMSNDGFLTSLPLLRPNFARGHCDVRWSFGLLLDHGIEFFSQRLGLLAHELLSLIPLILHLPARHKFLHFLANRLTIVLEMLGEDVPRLLGILRFGQLGTELGVTEDVTSNSAAKRGDEEREFLHTEVGMDVECSR